MRISTAIVVLALVVPISLSGQQPNPLAATYQVKVGDIAASTLSEFLKLRTDFRDPALVTYEPETGTIDIEVFATPAYGSKTRSSSGFLGEVLGLYSGSTRSVRGTSLQGQAWLSQLPAGLL